jgi:hypothetical protein
MCVSSYHPQNHGRDLEFLCFIDINDDLAAGVPAPILEAGITVVAVDDLRQEAQNPCGSPGPPVTGATLSACATYDCVSVNTFKVALRVRYLFLAGFDVVFKN